MLALPIVRIARRGTWPIASCTVFRRDLRTGSQHSFADSEERHAAVEGLTGWNEVGMCGHSASTGAVGNGFVGQLTRSLLRLCIWRYYCTVYQRELSMIRMWSKVVASRELLDAACCSRCSGKEKASDTRTHTRSLIPFVKIFHRYPILGTRASVRQHTEDLSAKSHTAVGPCTGSCKRNKFLASLKMT